MTNIEIYKRDHRGEKYRLASKTRTVDARPDGKIQIIFHMDNRDHMMIIDPADVLYIASLLLKVAEPIK